MHAMSFFLSLLFNDIGGGGGECYIGPSFMIAVLLPYSAVLVAEIFLLYILDGPFYSLEEKLKSCRII